jgi:hypothetical protein
MENVSFMVELMDIVNLMTKWCVFESFRVILADALLQKHAPYIHKALTNSPNINHYSWLNFGEIVKRQVCPKMGVS